VAARWRAARRGDVVVPGSFGVVACFAWTHRDRGHLQMGCVTAGEYEKMRRFDYFLYINSNLNEGPSYTDYKM